MHDYLMKTNTLFEISVPERSAYLQVKAITKLPETEEEVPEYAPGYWHIISIAEGEEFPSELESYVKANSERSKGLNLPDGVVSLSTVWAGMLIRS